MTEGEYPKKTLELVYGEIKDALNNPFQSIENLDTKASVIIGFVGVIIGISLNLYPPSSSYLFGSYMTVFLLSFFFSFSAYKTERYRSDPEPRKLTEKYLRERDYTVKKQLIDNFIQSHEDNKKRIDKKARYLNHSFYCL
ncbi:MAG TPA: hypothetical protein HA232_00840 [Methanocellales archaeon]|nr:hypothetical protein [Methanocellales archaeon]